MPSGRSVCHFVFLWPQQWIPIHDWVAIGSAIFIIQCISTPVQSLDLSRATKGVTWFLSSLASWENITSWSGMFTPANYTTFITVNSFWGCLPLILSDLAGQTKVPFALWQKNRVGVCKNIWKFCCHQFFVFATLFAPETSTSFCVTKDVNWRNYKWSRSQTRWSDEG